MNNLILAAIMIYDDKEQRTLSKYRSNQLANCWNQWQTDESVDVLEAHEKRVS